MKPLSAPSSLALTDAERMRNAQKHGPDRAESSSSAKRRKPPLSGQTTKSGPRKNTEFHRSHRRSQLSFALARLLSFAIAYWTDRLDRPFFFVMSCEHILLP